MFAEISRQIFEATHRPSIEVIVDEGQLHFYGSADNYMFPSAYIRVRSARAAESGCRLLRDGLRVADDLREPHG